MRTRLPRLVAIRLIKAQIDFFEFSVLKRQLFVPTPGPRLTYVIITSIKSILMR